MASLEAAERAITALNNSTPPGAVQSLIVRFAESVAEKAARLHRREAKSLQRLGAANGALPGQLNGGIAALGADQLQQALSALSLGGAMPQAAAVRSQLPPAPLVPQSYQPQVLSSICIKGEHVQTVEGQGSRAGRSGWGRLHAAISRRLHLHPTALTCHPCPAAQTDRDAAQCRPPLGV